MAMARRSLFLLCMYFAVAQSAICKDRRCGTDDEDCTRTSLLQTSLRHSEKELSVVDQPTIMETPNTHSIMSRAGARLSSQKHKYLQLAMNSERKTSGSLHVTSFDQVATCAVCFIGQLRALDEIADGLRTNLLKPIASEGVLVDVFVAAEQGGLSNIDTFGLPHVDPNARRNGTPSIVNYTWRTPQTAEELEDALISKAPKELIDALRRSPGNWLGPMFSSKGNGAKIYRLQRDCIDMIMQSEENNHMRYTWVMRTRPDFVWLVPHPPLSLTGLSSVWHFSEEGYGGVNVRHLFGSRDMMMKLIDLQHLLEVGDPVVYDMVNSSLSRNDEFFNQLVAEKFGAQLGIIAYVAYLHASPAWAVEGWRNAGDVYSEEVRLAKASASKFAKGGCWASISDSSVDITACSQVASDK